MWLPLLYSCTVCTVTFQPTHVVTPVVHLYSVYSDFTTHVVTPPPSGQLCCVWVGLLVIMSLLDILYYTVQNCTVLHCTTLHYTALYTTALHCTSLLYTALHCTLLLCTALHCFIVYMLY